MEQIINLDGLYSALKNLIDKQADIKDIIVTLEKIHLAIFKRDLLGKDSQERDMLEDIDIISKIGFYLLSVLIDETENQELSWYGMSVAGFCFELISKLSIVNLDDQWEYNFYSSVCYSFSENQANAIVLAKDGFSKLNISKNEDAMYPLFFMFLSRRFKDLIKYKIPKSKSFFEPIINLLKEFSRIMIFGGDGEQVLTKFHELKQHLYTINSQYFFPLLLIYKVSIKMYTNSIRNLIQSDPDLKDYLNVVTQIDTTNVYELWASQKFLMNLGNKDDSFLSDNSKGKISIIAMPTSAGKTMIAELAIYKAINKKGGIVIYVVPSLALGNEIENSFFRRFRKVGIYIKKEIDVDSDTELNFAMPQILILTPEKLDLIMRKRSEMLPWIRLVIIDEFHKASDGERGWLLETIIGWFMLLQKTYNYQIVMMSAIISNLEQSITNDNITLYQNQWSPTRKLYGLYYLPESKRIKYVKDKIKKGQLLQEPYSLALRYQRNKAIIESVFYKEHRGRKTVNRYDPNASDTKYDLCWKAINSLNELPILIYFFTKNDINHFIDRSGKYFARISGEPSLDDLKRTIIKKIGATHKLCKALDYGVAFHNGDLPEDVRIAIENAYRNKVIKILACTTTLADGVNLPVSTLIIGSCFNFDCTRGINNSDYKNIVGRIGRALTDTEGKIFIIKHNEYYKDETVKQIFSFTKPSELETPLISAIDKATDEIDETLNYVESVIEGGRISQDLAIQKMIDRLQVFVFSLYEQIEAQDFESFYQEYVNCFFINTSEKAKKVIKPVTEAMYKVVSNVSSEFLHKCNSTGLSYISNKKIEAIVQRIIYEFSEFNFSDELLITKDIYSQILSCQEFVTPFQELDDYGILRQWLRGDTYISIRNSYFNSTSGNIEEQTQYCTQYIREMFQYKLPWAFSALIVFLENTLLKSVFKMMPQYIKYGSRDENAIELCMGGIDSRELAITLSNCYSEDKNKGDDDITNWLVKISQNNLAKLLDQHFDYYTLNQVSKFRSVRREMSYEFAKRGYLPCDVAGTFAYDYRKAYDNNIIIPESIVLFKQDRNNAYDMYAVSVYSVDFRFKLGYIPAVYSEEIFDLIEGGDELYGIVQSCDSKVLSIQIMKTPVE